MGLGPIRIKKEFLERISYKIFETNSSLHVKLRTTGKV